MYNSRATLPLGGYIVERGYIDGKDGEHRHAQDWKDDTYNLAKGRDRGYRRAHSGEVHPCPPHGVAEAAHGTIYRSLKLIEHKGGEVGADEHRGDICPEETRCASFDEPAQGDEERHDSSKHHYPTKHHLSRMTEVDTQ